MPVEINDFELTWYMQEIGMHALGARLEFDSLLSLVGDPETAQTRLVWFRLTAFLGHVAMMSKYLDPIQKRSEVAQVRKERLRAALAVQDDSPILLRDARDNVEHFDERIDGWTGKDNHQILEIVLPEMADFARLRVEEKRVKRVLVVDTLLFISERRNNQQFQLALEPVRNEADRIGHAAEHWVKQNSPYHFVFPR